LSLFVFFQSHIDVYIKWSNSDQPAALEGSHKRVFDMKGNSRKPCCSSKLKLEMDNEMIYLKHL
jgi:hypothetical protein